MNKWEIKFGGPVVCRYPDCNNKSYAKGYCKRHYNQSLNGTIYLNHLADQNPMPPRCEGCKYRRPIYKSGNDTMCYYILDTEQPRGCSIEDCDKWEAIE